MLPVLWHHPFVCLGITHLDENGWANLTQTLALPIAISRKKCVVVVTVDTTGLVKGGAIPPPLPLQPLQPAAMYFDRRRWRSLGRNFSDCAPTRDVAEAELRGLEAHSCSSALTIK